MKEMPQKSVDMLVTDPPYFVPQQSYVGTRKSGYKKRHLADMSIFKNFFNIFFGDIDKLLNSTGEAYVFCDAKSYPFFYQSMFPYFKHVRLLIWDKIVSYNGYTWRHQHELIAWGERQDAERVPTGDGDILKCRGVLQADRLHPAEKPVELLTKLISKHELSVVLDPFMGSGAVGQACIDCDRDFIGIELDEDYFAIAEKRIQSHQAQPRLEFA
jgi:site-specific DNA-methyltransferase (adenine-specific)